MAFEDYINFYREQQYLSDSVAEQLSKQHDAYLPLIEAIYLHPNKNIQKKGGKRASNIKLPFFLSEMFTKHKNVIRQILANEPLAITKLLSLSINAAQNAVFADRLIFDCFLKEMFDLDFALELNTTQKNSFAPLHQVFIDLHNNKMDIISILETFKHKDSPSPEQLYKIANELINDPEHRLIIIKQLLECGVKSKLSFIAETLQVGSINSRNINQLMNLIIHTRVSRLDALIPFSKELNRRFTIDEVCLFLHKNIDSLTCFYSNISQYFLNTKQRADLNSPEALSNYKKIWYTLVGNYFFDSENRYKIDKEGFHQFWQLYYSVPEKALSVAKWFTNETAPVNAIKNITSYPVAYFLFDEGVGDPRDRFHKIVGLTDAQREHFDSFYIALLLKNKMVTVEQVLCMETWQREYLEIWMSTQTNKNLTNTRNFIVNLPNLNKEATEGSITQFFQDEYRLDRDQIPLSQRKNISCAALRLFFRGKDVEQLLHCTPEQYDDINRCVFCVLLAGDILNHNFWNHLPYNRALYFQIDSIFKPLINLFTFFNPAENIANNRAWLANLTRLQIIPLRMDNARRIDTPPRGQQQVRLPKPTVASTINYSQSTHNNIVEASTAESIKKILVKYRQQKLDIEDIYNTMAKQIVKNFCKTQEAVLLARYKKHANNSDNDDAKIPVTPQDYTYFIVTALLKIAVLPQKTYLFTHIMLFLNDFSYTKSYINGYNFVSSLLLSAYGFEYRKDVKQWFFNPTEEFNLDENWSNKCDVRKILDGFRTMLATNNIAISTETTINYRRINVSILSYLLSLNHLVVHRDTLSKLALFKEGNSGQEPEKFSAPVTERIKWFVILKTFLKLDYLSSSPYLTGEKKLLFFYFWLELQDEGAKKSADVVDILTDTLFEIGSTYSLDEDEKHIILAQKTERGMAIRNGFIPSCPGGAANKFMEKLASISPLVEICFVNGSVINMRIEKLLLDHSIQYLLSLDAVQRASLLETMQKRADNLNLDSPITVIWPNISPGIRDSLINEFSKTNPGVRYLNKKLPDDANDKIKTDYRIFKECLDNYEYITFDLDKIQQAINTPQPSSLGLVIDDIIKQKVEEYGQRLVVSNPLFNASTLWDGIKDEVIREIIRRLSREYPGIAELDTSGASSSRAPSDIEINNLVLVRTYIANNSLTIIEKIINNEVNEEPILGKRETIVRADADMDADYQPPVKRHCLGLFSQPNVKFDAITPPASPQSPPSPR